MVSMDSGALLLLLILPLTTSANRLSPPQAGAGAAGVITEPNLVAAFALTSTAAFEAAFASFAIDVEATDLAATLCDIGVLATLMVVSTAGKGGNEVAWRSNAVNAAAAVCC